MTWREWALKYLTEERDDLRSRIEVIESGQCWFGERRDGGEMVDTTSDILERNKRNLAEIERIIEEATRDANAG